MKLYNKFLTGVSTLLLSTALVGCSDDGNWTPQDTGSVPQVYFADSEIELNVSASDTEFEINIYRLNTSAPSSVALQWSGDTELFDLPTSATFDSDATMAILTAGFDVEEMELNVPYELTVSIVGGDPSTIYSSNSIAYTITYVPYSDWEPFGYNEALGRDGEGYYTFANYYEGVEDPVRVMSRYNLENPDEVQYEFQWLEDYDDPDSWETFLTAESSDGGANITVPEQPFAMNPTYGQVYVSTAALYNPAASSGDSYFDESTGTFQLDLIYYVSAGYFGYGYETCVMNGYEDTRDFTVTLSDNGNVVIGNVNYQIVNISWTTLDLVQFTVVETESIQEDGSVSQDLIDALVDKMQKGEVEAQILETPGNVTFDFEASGNYTVVAAGLMEDSSTGEYEVKSTGYVSFQYDSADPNEGWDILGMVQYTDGYLCSLFNGVEPLTYSVEIQENQETPGLYRLVNPYGEAYPDNEPGDWNAKVNSYLVINAEDPDGVYILESPQTLDWGYGVMSCYSIAGNYIVEGGYPIDVVKDAGYCGTLSDGKITFPAKTLLVTMADLGGWYYANVYGDDDEATFCVDLNTLTSATSAKAKSKSAKADKGSIKVKGAKKAETFKSGAKVVKYNSKAIKAGKREPFRKTIAGASIIKK